MTGFNIGAKDLSEFYRSLSAGQAVGQPSPAARTVPPELREYFPEVDPGVRPFGSRVLVQLKIGKKVTQGGIIIPDSAQEADHFGTQVALVVNWGPLAFCNRETMKQWPEGRWVEKNMFVRVPQYGGDRWTVKHNKDDVLFVLFNDLNILGEVTGDPTAMKARI